MGPDSCILAFNKALDQLVEEILTAASTNPICWPCPEVELLEKSSRERMMADMFLPSVGWSSPARTEPLIRALKGCKLPIFSDDLSFLSQGSYMGLQIPNQKLAFEDCSIKYLTQSCKLLSWDLAVMEANVMVQRCPSLELRGSCYYIIPRWVRIFRRIYNWRLLNLLRFSRFSYELIFSEMPLVQYNEFLKFLPQKSTNLFGCATFLKCFWEMTEPSLACLWL
ncbi:putative SAC3 family protein B [Cocos nucifera]|nr:putative SAC3 family protein B [Cocos nucifera]